MNFNYLADAPPDAIERIRSLRIAPEIRTPLSALVTACFVVVAWWSLEQYWISDALREQTVASVRLQDSRAAFAATKLVRSNVQDLLALDARLRQIRLSGSLLSGRLADLGNHVPSQAWLTSISHTPEGLELAGHADGLNALSQTVAELMSSKVASAPTLVRAVKEDRSKGGLISFTMRVKENAQ